MGRARLGGLGVAALALLLAASAVGSRTAVPWRVDAAPFRVTIADGGLTLEEAPAPARLRYQLADGTQHTLTDVTAVSGDTYTVATDEPGRVAKVTLTQRPAGVRISTVLIPTSAVTQVYDAFGAAPAEHWMGGGERGDAVDLRGQIVQVKVSYRCSEAPAPFVQSSRGYGIRLATDAVSAFAFPGSAGGSGCTSGTTPPCTFPPLTDRFEVCAKGARLDEDVYVGDPQTTHDAYVGDVGAAAVPPLSEYALMKWRDVVTSPAQLFEDVSRLRKAGVPVGWVILDNPWESCVGTLVWDRSTFPDPAGMVARLHGEGVKVMLWASPDVFCPDGAGYDGATLVSLPFGWTIDLSNPTAAKLFRNRLRSALAVGIDGVKGDRADEADLEPRSPIFHNDYPLVFQQNVVQVLRSLRGNDFATLFRAGSSASPHLVHGFWNGDQPGDFTGLVRTIRQAATAGLGGFSVWGSDVGGYSSDALTPQVFARWAQLGAISPVFEVGGTGPNATPWAMGAEAMHDLASAARLHYALIPYFDALVRAKAPVLRPLAYGYPGDAKAWQSDLELLVGPDLLAAPVTGLGTGPSVYLPKGTWIDLYAGTQVRGGRTFIRENTPYDQFPLYARQGAVVPFALRTAKSPLWSPAELSHAGRAGFLATDGALLDLTRQPATVQVFVPAARRPRAVSLAGRKVAFTWEDGLFPGVAFRVHGPTVRGRVAVR